MEVGNLPAFFASQYGRYSCKDERGPSDDTPFGLYPKAFRAGATVTGYMNSQDCIS